ncbi:hypothetical protein [Anaeromyxobacter sp. Fw109-5]|uniref:hypothetical protein n=1 Tax=Anaeromyxobacter sp. (strain Fw109-5) TaxID=404589 RepID=UPI0002D6B33D|nr:hypothetical protein [Anaeromyxobacter sp. Fw109-5]
MKNANLRFAVAAVGLLLAAAPARAQLDEGAGTRYAKDSYPTQELVRQPLTLSRGLIELGVPVRFEISDRNDPRVADWSLPASIDFGVSDDLQLGVIHSTGLCFAGDDGDCDETYDDIGGRARFGFVRMGSEAQVAIEARVNVFDFSDSLWTGAVGLLYKRTLGPSLAVLADVDWTSFLNDRDAVAFTDAVAAALGLQLQIFPGLSAFGNVGVDIPLNERSDFDARMAGPVSAGLELTPVHNVTVGADVKFSNLVGKDDGTSSGFLPLERFPRSRGLLAENRSRGDERFLSVYARLFL